MKIVVLDGYTLNPGDLKWEELNRLGELQVYERTTAAEVKNRCAQADIVLTNKTPINRETIEQLSQLKYISVLATGYNIVDVTAAKEKGIKVSNVPGYGTDSVVQLTFALILEHMNQVALHSAAVKAGEWSNSKDFMFTRTPLSELSNKTLGIIGFGTIGQQVSEVARAFGMQTIAVSRTKSDQRQRKNFRWVELEELFATADIITLHCPLTEQTKGMINAASLKQMKKTALLINTSRGPLINEQDLADALIQGTVAGAAVDVFRRSHQMPAILCCKHPTALSHHILPGPRGRQEKD
jgi:glycerate dehydrogenase